MTSEKFTKSVVVAKINNKSFWKYEKGVLFGVLLHQTKKAISVRVIHPSTRIAGEAVWMPKSMVSIVHTHDGILDCEHMKASTLR